MEVGGMGHRVEERTEPMIGGTEPQEGRGREVRPTPLPPAGTRSDRTPGLTPQGGGNITCGGLDPERQVHPGFEENRAMMG